MADTHVARAKVDRVYDSYNPENDTIPGAPSVTWADATVADAVLLLVGVIEEQQKRIDDLEAVLRRNLPA